MVKSVRVIGVGGSLRAGSTSRSALRAALDGALAAGAEPDLIGVRELDLPMYTPERPVPAPALRFAEAAYACDALIWSTPTYHGSVSGSLKNALDWLILLADREPPYLTSKPVGLVAAAGGIQGLQAVSSLDFVARALRGWSVPLVMPVAQAGPSFDPEGRLVDELMGTQLRELGAEVVRAARQFQSEGSCDYADARQFADPGHRWPGAALPATGPARRPAGPAAPGS
jgi:FMN reductase